MLTLFSLLFLTALIFATVGPFSADASASPSASQLRDQYLGSANAPSIAGPEIPAHADDSGFWPHRQFLGPNAAVASEAPISVSGTGYISGFVNDIQTGDPIEGVEIDVIDAETGEWLSEYSTYTDENGAYSISGLPNISVYVATYSYPLNYIDQWFGGIDVPGNWNAEGAVAIDLVANPTRTYINFRLDVGCVITGTVSNSSGSNLADVEIDAYDTDSGALYGYGYTGANGVYYIIGIPQGTYYVATYNDSGYIDEWYNNVVYSGNLDATDATAVALVYGDTVATGINFSLALGRSIAGKVMDSNGLALSDVAVDAYDLSGNYAASGYTGPDGSYSIRGLPAAQYRVRTDDYESSWVDEWWCGGTTRLAVAQDPEGSAATIIDLRSVSVTGKDFHLNVGRQVGGHVYDSSGDPLEGVEIDIAYTGSAYETYALTDDTGAWWVEGLYPGTYLIHTLNDLGYIDEWSDGQQFPGHLDGVGITPVDLTSSNASVQLYLDPGHTIAGFAGWALYTPGVIYSGSPPMVVEITDAAGTIYAGSWVGDDDGSSDPSPYNTWALPSGTYYARIVRVTLTGFAEQWYDNLPCAQYDLASATPIPIANANVTGVDFPLVELSYHEQDEPHILYSGTWSSYGTTWASGGAYMRSNTSGSSATISFTGISLDWIATMTGSTSGKADVYVDEEYIETVDLSSFTPAFQQTVFSTGDLLRGPHAVRIAWNSSNATGSKYITLDAVRIDGTIANVPPSITSLSPTTGAIGGGTQVTINGVGFVNVSSVLFGDTPTEIWSVVSPTKITATAPAHEEGPVRVKVNAAGGTSRDTAADDFTYEVAPTRYDDTDPNIAKTGTWTDYSNTSAYGGTYARSSTAGASATIYFTGTKIAWIGMTGSTPGIVDVYLDGAKKTTLDLYSSPAAYQVALWTSDTLPSGMHHLDLVRNSGSLPAEYLVLDALDIWGEIAAAPTGTTITLRPGWNLVAAAPGTSFPGTLFGWNGSAYESASSPEAWHGYWCKMTQEQSLDIETEDGPHPISLSNGWNLIGNPMALSATLTLPAGVMAFVFDTASGSYQSSFTLLPGQGAWVKAAAGQEAVLAPSG